MYNQLEDLSGNAEQPTVFAFDPPMLDIAYWNHIWSFDDEALIESEKAMG